MDILTSIFAFLVMLNPFALFLYLRPVMQDLSPGQFRQVFLKASVISFFIYLVFLLFGNFIFEKIFQINFESFRIFGGIVLFSLAYLYIIKGQKGFIQAKENLDDLASEIALPFMVGAGTISLAILLGDRLTFPENIISLVSIMIINYLIVIGLIEVRVRIAHPKFRIAFDKNMEILIRINGFFVGAIGINMILNGITNILN